MAVYKMLTIDKWTSENYAQIRALLFDKYGTRTKRQTIRQKRPEALVDGTTSRELGIQENDLWIAAIAVRYNCFFVTTDVRMRRIMDIVLQAYPDYPEFHFIDLSEETP
jgi:predicted nucleic acid-binding protein